MAYDPASLQPGDIILVRGHPGLWPPGAWLDAAIEWATVSSYAHACIVGEGHIIEALWRVTASPLDKYCIAGDRYTIDAPSPRGLAAARWCEQRIGQRYGIAALLEDGAIDIGHVPITARLNPRHVVCSGLVALGWRLGGGVRLTWRPLPSPGDLADSPVLLGPRPWRPRDPQGGLPLSDETPAKTPAPADAPATPTQRRPLRELIADCERDIQSLQKALQDGEHRLHQLLGRHATLKELAQNEEPAPADKPAV